MKAITEMFLVLMLMLIIVMVITMIVIITKMIQIIQFKEISLKKLLINFKKIENSLRQLSHSRLIRVFCSLEIVFIRLLTFVHSMCTYMRM
jgi:hypothetical protein